MYTYYVRLRVEQESKKKGVIEMPASYRAKIRKLNAQRGKENRRNGEEFEYRVLRKFKKRSDVLFAIRSAGSHSIVDIIVHYLNGKQLWINCKRNGYLEPRERGQLERLIAIKPVYAEIRMYYYKSPKKMGWMKIG